MLGQHAQEQESPRLASFTMTFLKAPWAARRGGHRLVEVGRTPNGLYRMLVCERGGGKILARSAEESGGSITVWSCTPREARSNDRYWWIQV